MVEENRTNALFHFIVDYNKGELNKKYVIKHTSEGKEYLLFVLPKQTIELNTNHQVYQLKKHHMSVYKNLFDIQSDYHYTAEFNILNVDQTMDTTEFGKLHMYFNSQPDIAPTLTVLKKVNVETGAENFVPVSTIGEEPFTKNLELEIGHRIINTYRQNLDTYINDQLPSLLDRQALLMDFYRPDNSDIETLESNIVEANQLLKDIDKLLKLGVPSARFRRKWINGFVNLLEEHKLILEMQLSSQLDENIVKQKTIEIHTDSYPQISKTETKEILPAVPVDHKKKEQQANSENKLICILAGLITEKERLINLSKNAPLEERISWILDYNDQTSFALGYLLLFSNATVSQHSIIKEAIQYSEKEAADILAYSLIFNKAIPSQLKHFVKFLDSKFLFTMIAKNEPKKLEWLIEHGNFSLNKINELVNLTPLSYAFKRDNLECFTLLLQHGAKVGSLSIDLFQNNVTGNVKKEYLHAMMKSSLNMNKDQPLNMGKFQNILEKMRTEFIPEMQKVTNYKEFESLSDAFYLQNKKQLETIKQESTVKQSQFVNHKKVSPAPMLFFKPSYQDNSKDTQSSSPLQNSNGNKINK